MKLIRMVKKAIILMSSPYNKPRKIMVIPMMANQITGKRRESLNWRGPVSLHNGQIRPNCSWNTLN